MKTVGRLSIVAFAFGVPIGLLVDCGMVTGLSDDFTFEGGVSGADGSQDGSTDGSPSGDGGPDARREAGSCMGAPGDAAATALAALGGSVECRNCMTSSCCAEVNACHNDCATRLACDLDCTTKGGNRQGCIQDCATSKPAVTFDIVHTCASQQCVSECGF
jgi:hypothetical protein